MNFQKECNLNARGRFRNAICFSQDLSKQSVIDIAKSVLNMIIITEIVFNKINNFIHLVIL